MSQDLLRNIAIYDTTLRDGSQGEGISFSLQDKLAITARLAEFGIDYIEGGTRCPTKRCGVLRQGAAVESRFIARLRFRHDPTPRYESRRRPGHARSGRRPDAGVHSRWQELGLPCDRSLNVSLEENLDMIGDSVQYITRHAECVYDAEHFFDASRPIPSMLARRSARPLPREQSGVSSATPMVEHYRKVAQIVTAARTALSSYPNVQLGIHCHNDGELANANSLSAVDAGCNQVQGTINGIGERCGNADLISAMANLAFKKRGYQVLGGRSLEHLTELSRFVYETANLPMRNGQPFVGQSAFAHKGGMHVHASTKRRIPMSTCNRHWSATNGAF